MQDGWIQVRDVGYEDEEGFIYMFGEGRQNNDFIWRNHIYPEENRKWITWTPSCWWNNCIGVKDSYWGEKQSRSNKGSATKQQIKSFFAYNDFLV